MEFPLRLAVTKVTPFGSLLSVRYDVLDAGNALVKSDYFNCKPNDVVEVCAYTLERFSMALAQPQRATVLDRVSFSNEALLAVNAAKPKPVVEPPTPPVTPPAPPAAPAVVAPKVEPKPAAPPVAKPKDQTISPPGIGGSSKGTK